MRVLPLKENALSEIFGRKKPLVGTVHCLPFPGAPRYQNESVDMIVEHALAEAEKYALGGMDGIIVENGWDIPYLKLGEIGPETVSMLTTIANAIRDAVDLPLGIVVNANADVAAMAVAKATNASFIRANQWANAYIANAGFVQGTAAEVMRYRRNIGAESVKIFADAHVKHGAHAIVGDRAVEDLATDIEFFDADVVIATGTRTGEATPVEEILSVKRGTGLPVIVGSGLNAGNAGELLSVADGAIIASGLKEDGKWWNPVSLDRVKALVSVVNRIR